MVARIGKSVALLLYLTAVVFPWTAYSLLTKKETVCYAGLGCFSSGGPFTSSYRPFPAVPSSPDDIRTNFVLYTRDNINEGQELDARKLDTLQTVWTRFEKRDTKLIVNGYLNDNSIVSWFKTMKSEFLHQHDYNVIMVDWPHGNLPPYAQACANGRVVGAQIAQLIDQLQNIFIMSAGQFHIIGHSLGCHVAGYAGERTLGLGRITGLDPAGPFFERTDKVVRLDPTDAELVDVIHSDGNDILTLGLGTLEPMGDMDFYPNYGHGQPGCKPDVIKNLLKSGLIQGIEESVGCNHLRAVNYFIESIKSPCPFMAFPCKSEESFKAGNCRSCPTTGCPSMGLNTTMPVGHSGPTKYYMTTATESPFCQYHLRVKLTLSKTPQATEERGKVQVRVEGHTGFSEWLPLHKDNKVFSPGSVLDADILVPSDFGEIVNVEVKWHHSSSITDPFKWNILGLRNPKLYLRQIDVFGIEQGKESHFCLDDKAIETDKGLIVYDRCED